MAKTKLSLERLRLLDCPEIHDLYPIDASCPRCNDAEFGRNVLLYLRHAADYLETKGEDNLPCDLRILADRLETLVSEISHALKIAEERGAGAAISETWPDAM